MPYITRTVASHTQFHSGIIYYYCDFHQTEHGFKYNATGGTGIAKIIKGNNVDLYTIQNPFIPDPAMCQLSVSITDSVVTQSSP